MAESYININQGSEKAGRHRSLPPVAKSYSRLSGTNNSSTECMVNLYNSGFQNIPMHLNLTGIMKGSGIAIGNKTFTISVGKIIRLFQISGEALYMLLPALAHAKLLE